MALTAHLPPVILLSAGLQLWTSHHTRQRGVCREQAQLRLCQPQASCAWYARSCCAALLTLLLAYMYTSSRFLCAVSTLASSVYLNLWGCRDWCTCITMPALSKFNRLCAGHVLISPKRVVTRFAALSASEVADLWCAEPPYASQDLLSTFIVLRSEETDACLHSLATCKKHLATAGSSGHAALDGDDTQHCRLSAGLKPDFPPLQDACAESGHCRGAALWRNISHADDSGGCSCVC